MLKDKKYSKNRVKAALASTKQEIDSKPKEPHQWQAREKGDALDQLENWLEAGKYGV